MKIIPVLDLLDGIVVRGVAGRRNEYRAVESRLSANADVRTVAHAFREKLGLREFYVADLDAIVENRPNLATYRGLADDGFQLLVDAGIASLDRAREVLQFGATDIIAGLETSRGPNQLAALCDEFGAQHVIFSLDLRAGKPMGDLAPWATNNPFEIATQAIEAGVERMIVLDLAQVGVGEGLSTIELCRRLLNANSRLEVITGGGVRSPDDLVRLSQAGVHGALVASALHNGSITRSDLERLEK